MSIIDHNSSSRDERLHERGVHNHKKSEHGDIAALECQLEEMRAVLKRIAAHPIRTPVAGRRDVGLEPLPACQEIAEAALSSSGPCETCGGNGKIELEGYDQYGRFDGPTMPCSDCGSKSGSGLLDAVRVLKELMEEGTLCTDFAERDTENQLAQRDDLEVYDDDVPRVFRVPFSQWIKARAALKKLEPYT